MNQANISNAASLGNRNITPAAVNCWSMYIASLPESICIFQYLAEIITLSSRTDAASYTVPVYSELSLEQSLSPLSRTALDERITQIQSTNLTLEMQEYGFSILLFSNLVFQTAVSISGVASSLMANAGARLIETLSVNLIQACVPQFIYSASQGKNGKNPTELSLKDLISAKASLEKSKTKRFNRFMVKATDQVGTMPIGHTYVALLGSDAKNALEISLSDTPQAVVRPEQTPRINEYSDGFCFTIPLASLSIVNSTEYSGSSNGSFISYIMGKDSMYIASGSPLKNGLSIRSSNQFSYGRASAVDYSLSYAGAIISSRLVQMISTDI